MSFLLAFLLSAFVAMALIPPLARWALPLGLIDLPDTRKVHGRPVARIGGIAMVAGAGLALLLWVPLEGVVGAYLAASAVLLVTGVLDDRLDLDFRWKLAGQVLAALLVVVGGGLAVERMPLCGADPCWGALVGVPFTVLVLVGVTNAVNMSDGLDGLAGGTALLSIGAMALLAHLGGDGATALIGIILCGAMLGFLRYNTHPARVFMGDTGSQFLGFSAGVLAILVTQSGAQPVSAALPLLLLGLPVIDTLYVMARRVREGRSPFSPDRNHLHHRLLAAGMDHAEAVVTVYAVQAALVTAAVLLRYQSDVLLIGVFLLVAVLVAPLLDRVRRAGWRATPTPGGTWLGRTIRFLRERGLVAQVAEGFIGYSLPVLVVALPFAARGVSPDVAAVAVLALTSLLLGTLTTRLQGLRRVGLYLGAAVLAYVLEVSTGPLEAYALAVNVYFALVALALAVLLRFSVGPTLQVNPLDFLVVFLTALVPPVLEASYPGTAIGGMLLKFVVLCYAGELMLSRAGWGGNLALGSAVASVALVGLIGLV